jgi:hypothetical protein
MQQTAQWWEIAAVVVSALALVGTGFGVWFSKTANRTAEESKRVAEEANTIAREANDIARRTFESETVPDIQISLGSGQDLTTSPPTDLFDIQAGNYGRLPVVIQHVGVAIVGSVVTIPLVHAVVDKQDLHSKLPDLLPFEVLPGRVLDIPVPMEHLRKLLAINTKSPDDQFTVRLFQPTGQFFESFAQPIAPFLQGEPPVWVRFHKEPPPQASDAVEQPRTPLG